MLREEGGGPAVEQLADALDVAARPVAAVALLVLLLASDLLAALVEGLELERLRAVAALVPVPASIASAGARGRAASVYIEFEVEVVCHIWLGGIAGARPQDHRA